MKNIVVITALLALSFATGFTCSKNAPEQTAQPEASAPATSPTAPADQAQMAASGSGDATTAPTQPGTEAAPTAPTETH
jgi:hypothetical protein